MGAWRFDAFHVKDRIVEPFIREATTPHDDSVDNYESSELREVARLVAESMMAAIPQLEEFRFKP